MSFRPASPKLQRGELVRNLLDLKCISLKRFLTCAPLKLRRRRASRNDNDKKLNSGFTKVEILIGLGLFITVIIIVFNIIHPLEQVQMSQDKKRKADLMQVQQALNNYYEKYNQYPESSTDFRIMIGKNPLQWGKDGFIPYVNLLPSDPTPYARQYVYFTDHTKQAYWLYASLERETQDTDACGSSCSLGDLHIPVDACSTNESTAKCNYGVSSPNVSP